MSTPTIRQSVATTAAGAAATVTLGAGTAIGDVLLIFHGNDFFAASGMTTPTSSQTLSGMTLRATADPGTNEAHFKFWTAVVTVAGTQTVTTNNVGGEEGSCHVIVLDGTTVDAAILDGSAATGTAVTPGSASQIAPAVSPSTSDALLFCAAQSDGQSGQATYTAPSGMTERTDSTDGSTTGSSTASLVLSASGSTGTKTFTASHSAGYATVSVAVKGPTGAAAPGLGSSARSGPGHRRGPLGRMDLLRAHHRRRQDTGIVAAAAATNVAAADAAGTGTGNNTTSKVAPTPGLASGTGTGNNATVNVTGAAQAAAGQAAGTGTGNGATVKVAPTPALASGTGTAFFDSSGGSISLDLIADTPIAATGTAYNATISTAAVRNAPAGQAAGTGTGNGATVKVAPVLTAATGTGVGNNATVTVGTVVNAGLASGTGTGNTTTSKVAPGPSQAAGMGAGNNATVTTTGATNAPAGLASGTGTGNDTSSKVAGPGRRAPAPGTPSPGRARLSPRPASANNPTISTRRHPSPAGQAAATGTANDTTSKVAPTPTSRQVPGSGTTRRSTPRAAPRRRPASPPVPAPE